MRDRTALLSALVLAFSVTIVAGAGASMPGDRLWVLSGPKQLKRVAADDPTQVAETLNLAATVMAWGIPNDYTVETITLDPATGDFYALALVHLFLGDLEVTMRITRATGDVLTVNTHDPLPGALLRLDPASGHVHLIEGSVDTVIGVINGGETPMPALLFAPGDAHFGSVVSCVGMSFANSFPGTTSAPAYLLDATTDSLCTVDLATGLVTTIGALGIDLAPGARIEGPVIDVDGMCWFALKIGPTLERFTLDLATGAATMTGPMNLLTPNQDFALEISAELAVDADGDGYPTAIEEAAGVDPFDGEVTPFPGVPVPEPGATPGVVTSLTMRFDFAHANEDELTLRGRMPVSLPFVKGGQVLVFDIAGHLVGVTTGADGTFDAPGVHFDFAKKVKNGTVAFELRLKHASLAADLADEGLDGEPIAGTAFPITLDLWRSGAIDVAAPMLHATGKSGGKSKGKTQITGS